ncbi:protein NEDD1 isoform X2 [Gouania willdenowi]|uniref:protein NEDD1 isoform X2 n=1 Tax=Gouania willdenowi TaxID=441366 RepID=UPI001055F403|nr:protein NEDD1 isoform X2 [Gouania willdenowi]
MEDVTRLVSTGDCVKIWDAVSMTTLEQFNPHSSSSSVAQACWSCNNQYLVTSSSCGDKLVVSSLKTSPIPLVELADGKQQTRVCLSSSSQFVVSGGLDHCVHIWDLKTKRLHRSLKEHKEEVTCVSFNANDTIIASGSTSGDLVLHSLTTNLSSKAFGHGANQPIHDLRLSTLKRSLMGSVSDGGTVALWDANTQKELHSFEGAHKAPSTGLMFSPSSDLLVVSVGLDKKIVCYDTASKIILRPIRVEAPLTSVDFTLDGTGLVVGSTHGKIYQYDLRSSSAPIKITLAHKTSVTSLRYQSNGSRNKNSKLASSKISSIKRSSTRVSSNQTDSAPHRPPTSTGGVTAELMNRQADGHVEPVSNIGRNSLDIFSPAREDTRTPPSDAVYGRAFATSLETLSKDAEGQRLIGRASLDVFSPVRDEFQSTSSSQRRTPVGNAVSAAHCYTPLSPMSIKEEEPISSTEPFDFSKAEASGQEDCQTPPPKAPPTHLSLPVLPFFTPEPNLHRANQIQDPPTSSAGAALTASVSSALSQNIADSVGQSSTPLTSLQIHFIQNMIHDTLEEFRSACHQDIINLQVEMIRQFYIQLTEIHTLIEKHSLNESLMEEIERLKEENRRLRTNY